MLIKPTSYLADRFANVLQEPANGPALVGGPPPTPTPEPQDGYQATADTPQTAVTPVEPPPAPPETAPAYQSPVPTTIQQEDPQLTVDPDTGILRYQSMFPDAGPPPDPNDPQETDPQLTIDPTTGILRYQSMFSDPAPSSTSPAPSSTPPPSAMAQLGYNQGDPQSTGAMAALGYGSATPAPTPQPQGLLAELGYSS